MNRAISYQNKACRIRSATLSDAAFIVDLRNQKHTNGFIHQSTGDIGQQIQWLNAYFQREDDYYFIIEDIRNDQPVGTIGMVNVHDGSAEPGRWVMDRNSRLGVWGFYCFYQFFFQEMKLRRAYFEIVQSNSESIHFHEFCGARKIGVIRSEINRQMVYQNQYEFLAEDWPELEKKLKMLCR